MKTLHRILFIKILNFFNCQIKMIKSGLNIYIIFKIYF